jgi:ABC-2 type transport system permease protein
VRRELWEGRAIVIGPMIAGFILTASFVLGVLGHPERVSAMLALPGPARHEAVAHLYPFVAAMVAVGTFIAGVFYCIFALAGERSDRSILFWKSLPVSDTTTVLSKAAIPLVVLPLMLFGVALAVQAVMFLMNTLALIGTGHDPTALWRELPLRDMPPVLLYGVVVLTVLHAPIYGYLLMISAWAPRFAILWALLPPYAIAGAEQMMFGHSRVREFMSALIVDPMAPAFALDPKDTLPPRPVIDRISQLQPAEVFGHPGVWIGLLFTAACLVIAIRLRHDREPN